MLDPVFPELRFVCLWLLLPQHLLLLLEMLAVLLLLLESIPLVVDLESMVLSYPLKKTFLNSSGTFLMESIVLYWIRIGASLFCYVESSM